jgi:hypothetical protein
MSSHYIFISCPNKYLHITHSIIKACLQSPEVKTNMNLSFFGWVINDSRTQTSCQCQSMRSVILACIDSRHTQKIRLNKYSILTVWQQQHQPRQKILCLVLQGELSEMYSATKLLPLQHTSNTFLHH